MRSHEHFDQSGRTETGVAISIIDTWSRVPRLETRFPLRFVGKPIVQRFSGPLFLDPINGNRLTEIDAFASIP